MIRHIGIAAAGMLWWASSVAAQPLLIPSAPPPAASFEELTGCHLVGETVFVVDASGRETRGRVEALSGLILVVAVESSRRQFTVADVQRIDRRRRDSVRNGLLVGAGLGALAGFGLGRSLDSRDCSRSTAECGQGALIGTVGGAFWGAIGGWITDALIRKREVVYIPAGRQ